MKAQIPAVGILSQHDYGDAKTYLIACDCGCGNDHEVWVEADDCNVTVSVATKVKTNFWRETVKKSYSIDNQFLQEFDWFWKGIVNGLATRLRLTWNIWINGYAEHETSLILNEQQTINYANTLISAVDDVKAFRKQSFEPQAK